MSGDTTAETRSANNNTNSSRLQAVLRTTPRDQSEWGSVITWPGSNQSQASVGEDDINTGVDGQQLSLLCVTSNVFLIKFSIHLRTGSIALFHAYCLNVGHETWALHHLDSYMKKFWSRNLLHSLPLFIPFMLVEYIIVSCLLLLHVYEEIILISKYYMYEWCIVYATKYSQANKKVYLIDLLL